MRLTILTQFYPPDYAATGQLIEELARALAQKKINVEIFTGQPGYAFDQPLAAPQEVKHLVTIRRTRTSRLWPERIRGRAVGGLLYCLRAVVKLRRLLFTDDLLLVTSEPPYLPILAYGLKLLYGKSYLCLVYDLYPEVATTLGVITPHSPIAKVWRFLNHLTWRNARAIIVLSSTMKQRIVEQCPSVDSRVKVIHNWIDPNLVHPIPKTDNWFAQKYGLDKIFTVLYSGNMGRCHDLETIIQCAELMKDQSVQFVFIARGAKLSTCQHFVNKKGLNNCLFLPLQPKETIPYSLTACDLSLISLDKEMEGLIAPSKLYGCLAAGRPIAVVCEPHSYLREILAEAHCGRAVEPGDASALKTFIEELMAHPDKAQQMGEQGRTYLLQNFTLEKVAQEYYDLITSL